MLRDRIAVLRERILVETPPPPPRVSYPTSRLPSLEPSGDWKLQERRLDRPPRETLPRRIKEKPTRLPIYDSTLHEEWKLKQTATSL